MRETRPTPELAADLARAVRDEGGRALIVGGWVRDELLGRASKDLDLEVFGLAPERLRVLIERFGRVDTVGESFTVYKIGAIDVSLPRRESKIGRGHKGFAVHGDPALPIVEAARRRDFTVNAISRDPLTGEILDPFNGRADLSNRMLRAVDPATFADDSLRVLRAVQFAARLNFDIDESTRALCRGIPLDDLPSERIWGELEKLLLEADRPSIGLSLAADVRIVEKLFPDLVPLATCPQDAAWHAEGDVWTHTLMVVDEARKRLDGLDRGRAVAMMLAAVCHDLGKPATTMFLNGHIRSPGHEEAGVAPSTRVLDRLNINTIDGYDVRRTVLGIVAHHLKPSAFMKAPQPVGDGAFRRLAQKVDLALLARFCDADCYGRLGDFDCSAGQWFLDRARRLGVEHAPPSPLVMGRHLLALGVLPGPAMGEILKAVYEKQLDGEVASVEEGVAMARELIASRTRGAGE